MIVDKYTSMKPAKARTEIGRKWTQVSTGKIVDIVTTPNGGIWILNDKGDILERLVND